MDKNKKKIPDRGNCLLEYVSFMDFCYYHLNQLNIFDKRHKKRLEIISDIFNLV